MYFKISRLLPLAIYGAFLTLFLAFPLDASEDPVVRAGLFKYKEKMTAPSFSIQDIQGNINKLKDFRGKIVLIDFWTTW